MSFLSALLNSLPCAAAQGLIWGLMAIGVYITFRILDVADLTVDGSIATGGAAAVMLIRAGVNPWLALLCAFACGMLAGVVLTTTKVSEFLSAMNRLHAPKKLVIPLAVMLRYLPTVGEDWRYIKDAMRMRDVFPSVRGFLTAPGMTVECIYVPFMMAASKAADELSIAAVTRGIENPKPRTCLVQIRLEITDAAAVLLFLGYFAAGLYLGRSI